MDLETFEDGLDRYGADLATWPAAIRDAALAFVQGSAEAEAARANLRAIEDILRAEPALPCAVAAIASRAMRHSQERPSWRAVKQAAWGAAAVAVLVLGLIVGGVGLGHQDGPDQVLAAALDPLGTSDVD